MLCIMWLQNFAGCTSNLPLKKLTNTFFRLLRDMCGICWNKWYAQCLLFFIRGSTYGHNLEAAEGAQFLRLYPYW